ALDDTIDVARRALGQDAEIGTVNDEAAGRGIFPEWVDGGELTLGQRRGDLAALSHEDEVGRNQNAIGASLYQTPQGALDLVLVAHFEKLECDLQLLCGGAKPRQQDVEEWIGG